MPSDFALRTAALIVHAGGIVAYPTEAVYGLGCDPLDASAVARLLQIKQRDVDKGLILIGASFAQLRPFVGPLSASQRQRIEAPEPITWVAPPAVDTPRWITGAHNGVAVRVTQHPVARALCEQCRHAIVSTSANLAARIPARSALAVRRQLGDELDFVLGGAVGDLGAPTSIRDLQSGEVLR